MFTPGEYTGIVGVNRATEPAPPPNKCTVSDADLDNDGSYDPQRSHVTPVDLAWVDSVMNPNLTLSAEWPDGVCAYAGESATIFVSCHTLFNSCHVSAHNLFGGDLFEEWDWGDFGGTPPPATIELETFDTITLSAEETNQILASASDRQLEIVADLFRWDSLSPVGLGGSSIFTRAKVNNSAWSLPTQVVSMTPGGQVDDCGYFVHHSDTAEIRVLLNNPRIEALIPNTQNTITFSTLISVLTTPDPNVTQAGWISTGLRRLRVVNSNRSTPLSLFAGTGCP